MALERSFDDDDDNVVVSKQRKTIGIVLQGFNLFRRSVVKFNELLFFG